MIVVVIQPDVELQRIVEKAILGADLERGQFLRIHDVQGALGDTHVSRSKSR